MPISVKNTTFPGPLDLIAPHYCRGCGHLGNPLCSRCKKYIIDHHQNLCPICRQPNPTGQCSHCQSQPPTFIINTRTGLLANLIQDFKFESLRCLAQPLADILNAILPSPTDRTIIVPLPTINRHIRKRGFSHTDLIARRLAKLNPNYQVQNLLLRARSTVQVGSDKSTRLTQASKAYKLNSRLIINPSAHYLLLDDIWTTGATMQAATTLLQSAGATNVTLALLALSE